MASWRQGYQLAETFLKSIKNDLDVTSPIPMETIFSHLSIAIEDISLQDASVRAVSIAGPYKAPAVLVNDIYPYHAGQPRRLTLAHELCHILHDRSYGSRLALASGPWAPREIEQRANAFAAMLLMPAELVSSFIRKNRVPVDSRLGIRMVADAFETSFAATLEHLASLGEIDEVIRNTLRAEVENSVSQSNESA